MKPSVSIVIVNWNTGAMLADCCRSIVAAAAEVDLRRVIVVDNASADGSADGLAIPGLPLTVIRNQSNRGFAAACNQGAAVAEGELILFLNPDTRLYPDSLSRPLAYMGSEESAGVGICGIRLVDEDGSDSTSFAHFPSLAGFFLGALGLRPRSAPRLPAAEEQLPYTVDQVIGAYFLMRADLFRQLQGFDERFFVYFEEVDLSWRALQAGWRSVCLPAVVAFHLGGGSSNQVKAARLFYSLRSRLLFGFKHFSRPGAWSLVLISAVLEPISRLALCAVRRAGSDLRHTLAAYRMLYAALPEILRNTRR